MNPGTVISWRGDWAWSMPLILLTVVFHAFGLGFTSKRVTSTLAGDTWLRNPSAVSIFVMGGPALWATILHGFEGFFWAVAYRLLGALQGNETAMLYSLGAMSTYGHETFRLAATGNSWGPWKY